ncbi:uncharacterized protein LOC120351887 [Nilaparvata lugens]|uniref:uncharacterized protein LOC120351887 n=1 Tax=Nilaparvata lugens TaxID=108931 RepID=UPI00193EA675|nr:uncharacterized protein LOC120351887 [Nilaparvata lugens]
MNKSKRSGAPASKMKKYIFHEQMDFLRKVFDSRETEDTFLSENSSQESAETETQDSTPTSSKETQASKKKRSNETRKPDEFEAKLLAMVEAPNRHMASMQGLLPTLDTFTDDQVLEFQTRTLTLIQSIKHAPRIGPYSAPPQFAEQHQSPQTIGWGYSSTPQQFVQHHSLITAPQFPQEFYQSHYHRRTSVTSPITQMSDATTSSLTPTSFQNTE